MRKQKIKPGKTEQLREWIAELAGEAEADEEGVLQIWEEESLHTLSLFVEYTENGDYLVWYIEADSIDQLIEARQVSTHLLHDLEDAMMAEVLEESENVGDFEPLFHGVNPNRPQQFIVQR